MDAKRPDESQAEPPDAVTRADRIETFLGFYLKESMLWPVFIAVGAHVWVALSAVLLMVVRDRNPFAFFPLFVCVMATLGIVRGGLRRGHRVVPGMVLSAWVLAAVIAVIANAYKVY